MTVTMAVGGCIALAVLAFLIIALVALCLAPGQTPEVLAGLAEMITAASRLVRPHAEVSQGEPERDQSS